MNAAVALLFLLLPLPATGQTMSAATLDGLRPALALGGPGDNPPADHPVYSVVDTLDLMPIPWKLAIRPTYERQSGGGRTGYLLLQPLLHHDLGPGLWTRYELRIPEVNDAGGTTAAGLGDLTWLNLVKIGETERGGKFGFGPVFVFPTASSSTLGQGKYQIGPALAWVNKAVEGWHFMVLFQQFLSFAGDPDRPRVNELTMQPFITKLLSDGWYVQTKPTIKVDFAKGTSSVPLDLVIGKLVRGRWDLYLEATVYPDWTSPPALEYRIQLNVGYVFPSPLSRR